MPDLYEHNQMDASTRYVDENGFPLYQWLYDVRKNSKLREDIRKLNWVQFSWKRSRRNIRKAKSMAKEFGSLHVFQKNKKLDKAS